MSVKIKVSQSWKNVSQIKLKVGGSWKNVSKVYLKVNGAWKSLFSDTIFPSIENRVTVSSSGGINVGSTIMNNVSVITLTSTRYHWDDADVFTYIWQKSPDNVTWSNIGTVQSTTNPASGSSSSSITRVLSPSDFTSGSDMYFRFVSNATNSADSSSSSSQSLPILISYYGIPTPAPGSPSITGSTVVGNTASANIGTWTNSPTSYDYRVYYTSSGISYPLTYAGVKSVSSKFLSGFSAALVTSSAHGYKVNDTVVVSAMDSLFNGSHTITARLSDRIFFTLPTPTAYSLTSAYASGVFVSFNGNAYRAVSSLSASTAWTNASTSYSAGDNVYYNSNRYRANSSLGAASLWTDAGTGYSSGAIVYSGSNRYQANVSFPSVSAYSGGTFYSVGQIVYANSNRYQSKTNGNQGNSFTNTTYWTDLGSYALASSSIWTSLGSYAPGSNSMWTSVMPSNSSFWTLQSFSDTATSGTTTAPNYYEGTVFSSTSIPIPITTFDYRQGIDLRELPSSEYGAILAIGVKAYNQATLSPSEYSGAAFIYGIPILSIGSITPAYTTASVPFTSSYIAGYLLNLYTQPSITNVIGGASTVTYFANNTFTSGQQVTVTGVNPSQYNGTRTIQSANSTSFTVSANITGDYVSGGTAKVTVSGYPLTVTSNTSPRSITGLSQGTTYYLEMTPYNNGGSGTIQTSSFTTLIQPTISNISVFNSTPFPSSASSISVSNTPPSNTGSVSWTNGANTSVAGLFSMSGSGSGGSTPTNPSSLSTTGSFTVISTGTASATIRSINSNIQASVTWSQTNAQSYRIIYTMIGIPGTYTLEGNSSASNPSVVLGGLTAGYTITNITVYPNINQSGIGVTLSSTASGAGANRITDSTGSGSVTYTAPAVPPSGGSVSVNPTSGNAGITQFTASPSGWSGTAPITYTYVWSYFNNSFQWVSVGTGSTFTPSVISPTPLGWRVVLTAQNDAGTATATANFSVNNPPLTPSGLAATTTRTDGINVSWNPSAGATSYELWFGPVPTPSSIPDFLVGSATSYLDTSMTEGTNRTYYVRARNDAGVSAWSSGVSGTRALPTPNVTQITALGLGNTAAPYIRFTFTSTNAASLSIMLYRSATSSTGPWTALSARTVQSTTGTLSFDFSSRTGTTSNWYYVDVIPYSSAGGSGTAGTTRTSRVKRGTETTTTTVYP
jgi:hypothetical protein